MPTIRPFHLAIPVSNLAHARSFYGEKLGCGEGRSTSHWIDFDFFGVILTMGDWKSLRDRLIADATEFEIEPRIRFQGKAGEQATMFFTDPSGNALEFKAFNDDKQIFEK